MSQLFFKKRFQEAIRAGSKSTTIRRWVRPRVQVGQQAFCPGLGWLAIDAVDPVELESLDETDAVADGFHSLAEMRQLLHEIYPEHATDEMNWFRVRFHLHALHSRVKTKRKRCPTRI